MELRSWDVLQLEHVCYFGCFIFSIFYVYSDYLILFLSSFIHLHLKWTPSPQRKCVNQLMEIQNSKSALKEVYIDKKQEQSEKKKEEQKSRHKNDKLL